MTYHDKRFLGAIRGARGSKTRKLLLEGAGTITLWPRIDRPRLGTTADDWEAVGDDIRNAMSDLSHCG